MVTSSLLSRQVQQKLRQRGCVTGGSIESYSGFGEQGLAELELDVDYNGAIYFLILNPTSWRVRIKGENWGLISKENDHKFYSILRKILPNYRIAQPKDWKRD